MAEKELEKTEARQAVETRRVRWVLAASLALAVLLFLIFMAAW